MQLELKAWAFDILNAIQEIEGFVLDVPDFAAYRTDLKTRRAIERNLEIIGEAMNRMLSLQADLPFVHARAIVDTRNRIIHGYDSVSDEVIWSIVKDNLPTLRLQVEEFLK